jgi:hypothetical protein
VSFHQLIIKDRDISLIFQAEIHEIFRIISEAQTYQRTNYQGIVESRGTIRDCAGIRGWQQHDFP